MKKMIIAAAIAAGLGGTSAIADGHANSVSLQLQWVTQAQFAGYYVALDKGFYEAEGLDVTILAGGPGYCPSTGSRRWRRGCDVELDAFRLGGT